MLNKARTNSFLGDTPLYRRPATKEEASRPYSLICTDKTLPEAYDECLAFFGKPPETFIDFLGPLKREYPDYKNIGYTPISSYELYAL